MVDGWSRMVCGFGAMEKKNPIVIYDKIFRPAIAKYGAWNQLRIDHGKEFVLTIFVQELIEIYHYSRNKTPWKPTALTDNYVVERFWVKVNSRLNYPIKKILSKIIDEYDYDLNDPIIKHSLSFIYCNLARGPFQHLVQSWNYNMEMINKIPPLNLAFLPSTDEVVRMYECMGGQLTRMSAFGEDPLEDIYHAYESRKALLDGCQPGWGEQFSHAVLGRHDTIQKALEKCINLTLSPFTINYSLQCLHFFGKSCYCPKC